MANEVTLYIETGPAIPFTVANGGAIPKGTICEVEDLMTAAVSEADDRVAGVAATEKIASDGKVKLGCYREGFFKGTATNTIAIGDAIALSGTNLLKVATAANVASETVGIAMEAAEEGETFIFELRPGANNTAYS